VLENGRVTEVQEGSNKRLNVDYAPSGKASGLTMADGTRIVIVQDRKPSVHSIAGINTITGFDDSLSSMTFPNGEEAEYRFGTEAVGGAILPNLKIDRAKQEERLFTWDPVTKYVVSDGDWSYRITPAADPQENAAIARKNASGNDEFWFYDPRSAKETVRRSDGSTVVRYWYTGSKELEGKTHLIEQTKGGIVSVLYRAAYDQNGRLIRVMQDGVQRSFKYDEHGHLVSYRNLGEDDDVKIDPAIAVQH
jgi:YD repeat-containing protein